MLLSAEKAKDPRVTLVVRLLMISSELTPMVPNAVGSDERRTPREVTSE